MEPALRRWLLAAGLGAAAIAVAYLPPEPPEWDSTRWYTSAERGWEQRTGAALSRARRDLRAAEHRETLTRLLTAAGPADRPAIRVRGAMVPGATAAFRATVDSIWREIRPRASTLRFLVVLDGDAGGPNVTLPPSETGGTVCAQFVGVAIYAHEHRPARLRPWLERALAPCAYYAAFGAPGPAVGAWFTGGAVRYATDLAWVTPDTSRGARLPQDLGLRFMANMMFVSLTSTPPQVVACARGGAAPCRALFLDPATSWRTMLYPGESVLSGLIREQGPDRFGAFWRSAAAPDAAFAAAFGTDVAPWMSHWVVGVLGLVPGRTAVPLGAAFQGFLVMAGAFALAVVAVRRRQVG